MIYNVLITVTSYGHYLLLCHKFLEMLTIYPGLQVVACRLDGHTCVVNSVALALAGIHRDTPEPPGGIIVKDHKGGTTIVKFTLFRLVSLPSSHSVVLLP